MRHRSHHRRASTDGFTLIEVMISVAILAMATTLIFSAFSTTSRNKERLEELLDRNQEISLAFERMNRELQMAFVSAHLNPNPALQTSRTAFIGMDRGTRDRLDFCSFSHRRLYANVHESDQNELSYFVTNYDDPELGNIQVLARREQNRIDDNPQQGGRVEILVRDVEGIDFEYLDPRSGEWVREWDTSNAGTGAPNLLPTQVKIMLTVPSTSPAERRRGQTETFGTRVHLPLRWGLNHAIYNP